DGDDDVRPEDADAAAASPAHASPGEPVAAGGAKPASLRLRGGVVVRVEHAGNVVDIVEVAVDAADQHTKVRRPARLLIGSEHEPLMVMDGLGERDLLAVAGIIDPVAAVAEASRPERRAVHEGRHDEAGARTGD